MTSRPWTYEEKIRLRVGMRFSLLETEALALDGDTMEGLEKAAFQLRAERKDDLESALQRKLAPKTSEPSPDPPTPPLRSGSVSRNQNKVDPLEVALAKKVGRSM